MERLIIRNRLLLPLITVSVCGILGMGTFSGLFISKQIQFSNLKSSFEDLTNESSIVDNQIEYLTNQVELLLDLLTNTTAELEQQILDYLILQGNNTELQLEIDNLLIEYSDLQASYDALLEDYNDLQVTYNTLLDQYNALVDDYDSLEFNYHDLLMDYNDLSATYDDLVILYDDLLDNYNTLSDDYDALQILCDYYQTLYIDTQASLDMFLDFIIDSLPMAQKMAFYYQFVRNAEPMWWSYDDMCVFAEKLILHATSQLNLFTDVDTILNDYNFFVANSMYDNNETISNVFGSFYPYWNTGASLQNIQDWITNNIDYIYDSITTWYRTYDNDFFQSPLETFMYRGGDCDDYAILSCALFEQQGWETAFAGIFDPAHGLFGSFGHAFLFVKVGESAYPSTIHWTLSSSDVGYPWIPVDTLWCETIGDTPAWLQWYYDYGDATWISDHITIEIIDGVY
ncbi:MAG: transglutaminase-like domain-containing protein [Candidatus Heimdallarchaeota archaeon]